jgi:mRNA interferase RelE/StbE
MAKREMGVVDLRRAFSDTLNEVAYRDAEVVITRNGKRVAALVSMKTYQSLINKKKKVEFTQEALQSLQGLSEEVRGRLLARIRELPDQPYPADSRKLRAPEGAHRLKVGGYRIVYTLADGTVWVLRVGRRDEVYSALSAGTNRQSPAD